MAYFYFPCVGKRPAFDGWQAMSTADPDTIQGWLDEGYNLGLDTGKSDLTVVDLDPGSERPTNLPPTFERKTPRGGSHLLYQGACRGAGRKNLLGPHIDTRSLGGLIIWDGEGYDTVGNGLPLAPTPAWIRERLAVVETRTQATTDELDLPHNIARARLWLSEHAPAVEGEGGDSYTYQTACSVLDLGISPELAVTLMLEEWNDRCLPPWEPEDIAAKVENAVNYQQNEGGAWAQGNPIDRFAHAEIHTQKSAESAEFRIHDEDDQDAWQEPSWLIPHLIPDDSLVMIYGAKGTFKSFLALDAALHVASARPGWSASFDERQAVVYCAGEGPTSVGKFRRPAWRRAFPDIEGKAPFYMVKDAEFPKAASAESIERFIKGVEALKPRLVVIDTLHVFMTGLSEIKDDDCGIVIESLKQIKRRLGCPVLVIHHSGKNADQGARGHSSLTADMDVVHEAIGHQVSKAVALHNRYQKDADERQEPWCFEGRPSGRSLVFHPITLQQHRELTAGADAIDAAAVARALQTKGAIGHDKGISTHLLASMLYQGPSDESPETTIANRERLVRQLNAAAKKSLQVYAAKEPHGTVWSVPA